jgi:putative hydrolase of the HAD superfamily
VLNIVFDFGAVLFTWQPGMLMRKHFPAQANTAQLAAELAGAVFGHANWHEFDRGVVSAQEVCASTSERLGLDAQAFAALIDDIADHLQPMTETLALLNQLRSLRERQPDQIRLYFLSNMPVPYARVLERKHGFLQWFDGGVFSGDVKCIKPDAKVFALLAHQYGLTPANTLLIDDLPANVVGAKACGWQGIVFESASQLRTQLKSVLPADLNLLD